MTHLCPICNVELNKRNIDNKIDYFCVSDEANHHYAERELAGSKIASKIRVSENDKRYYVRVYYEPYYEDTFSEVWEGVDNVNRVRINSVIETNVKDINAVIDKIKMCLLFS